jgi:hypothetical protein
MNPIFVAAIIKKFGVQVFGGKYELFLTDSQLTSINSGSRVQETRDPVRGGVVFTLTEKPKVIDIRPIVPVSPQSPSSI